ncbi:TonB-dependent receptor [Maribellus sp. YY47]|uniref:TonB-dependent receptor n=1 Tax=Maribellus sp. YY47 TaxID=2929486 RepID=UPI00200080BF|nr:TonB-dependent receptor [Maribellus sp. YY47]MCK3686102.1 TonB-dependent receptor [Maribellus sp. YY47]
MRKTVMLLAAMLPFISAIKAQTNTSQDSIKHYHLEDIEIKSPKYNRNIFEIPAAATMVPERLIENNKIQNLTDISAVVPNFFMPDYGSKLTSPVYIRGVGNRINTPSVGLYVDGIPYFEKSAFNFDFFDVERIEVLRGPQGTLYGRNAMGGLINVITNQPGNKRRTSVSADYGKFNQKNVQVSHNQPITEKLSVLGNFNVRDNEGFFTNQFNNTKVDALESYSGRLKLAYNPLKNFHINGNIQYEDSKQIGYPYAVFNDSTNRAGAINYDHESLYNRKMLSTGINLSYQAEKFLFTATTSYQSVKDFQDIDQDFTPESLFFVIQNQKQHMYSQEYNMQSCEQNLYNWMFGIFSFSQYQDKSVTVEYGEDGLAKYRLPYNEYRYTKTYGNNNSGLAFFHQSTFDLGGLSFTVGLRADFEKAMLSYFYDKFPNGELKPVETFASEMDFFEILPRFALKYSISEYFVPYATVAKGYNSGGFNSTFEREEDRSFKPEESWNYEAGIKAKWLEQRVYANLAFFYIDWTNQQIYQTVPSGTGSMLTNAGKSESKGVEFELKALPAKNLETWFSFGYNDAKFTDYVKDENEDYSGNYIPYVPRFSFNAGANYTLELDNSWLDRVRFHVTYNGFGKHYWKETNEAYQDYYGLLNHRITFEKNNVTLAFWGKNILDANYNSFYFQALGNSYAQIGKPATMGFNLKIAF